MSEGWHAGFLSGNNLQLFVSHNRAGAWRPCVRTFVVVDYAASKVTDLRRLFEHFSAMEADALQNADVSVVVPSVRVLLLERHADETRGWLHELLSAGESITGDLLSAVCFLGVRKLQPPGGETAGGAAIGHSTRQIIENTFAGWAAIKRLEPPQLPNFNEKDWRRIQLRTGNRPLYLQMAAIHACERRSLRNCLRGAVVNCSSRRWSASANTCKGNARETQPCARRWSTLRLSSALPAAGRREEASGSKRSERNLTLSASSPSTLIRSSNSAETFLPKRKPASTKLKTA